MSAQYQVQRLVYVILAPRRNTLDRLPKNQKFLIIKS